MKDREIRDLALTGARSGEFKLEAWPNAEIQRDAAGGAFVTVCVYVPASYIGRNGPEVKA